ncbi:helix-turn-helix domain-containing protein [Picrophilus oshimae]|uniref:Transposase n=1 Tax=Picrophilus torridus (strain ATCC 700027 / DSM 9790 / JCM 10055 / NBRC 100828 / KAW 2/3) TaxID=1122961 RepID=A0A8G2L8A3_PICTO|nr:helix-turn-helix domain-containing protein [Picrophilus oshimae]SMD31229.1 Transposase [Picrophilus oshimae DSM 9789]
MTKYDELLQNMTFYSLESINNRIKYHERELKRLKFIRLILSGVSVNNASRICGFSRQYGYKIIKNCIKNNKSKKGRHCKLNSSQMEILINYLNEKMPFSIIDVKCFLEDQNIKYCEKQIRRIINGLGFSYCRLLKGYINVYGHKKLIENIDDKISLK